MATDSPREDRKGDCSHLPANVTTVSAEIDLQDVHHHSIQATRKGKKELVTGNFSRQLSDTSDNESGHGQDSNRQQEPENLAVEEVEDFHERPRVPDMSDTQQKQKRAGVICACVVTILILLSVGLVISGGVYQAKSSCNKESAKEYIVYENDTILVAEVTEENVQVSLQQLCRGGGDHTIELYLAPSHDLKPHCFNANFGVAPVNATRSPTITEVYFNGLSYIYMTSHSNITFTVDFSTPMASTSLVIFNNYNYFTDFVLSDHPDTHNALDVYTFKEQSSSYTFRGDTNTYFVAFESLSGIDFTFHYSGYVCNYSYLDYNKSECELPASTCQQNTCTYKYQPHNKTYILGHVPFGVTHPTFACLQAEICRKYTTTKDIGIALLVVGILLFVVIIIIIPLYILLFSFFVTIVVITIILLRICKRLRSDTRPTYDSI